MSHFTEREGSSLFPVWRLLQQVESWIRRTASLAVKTWGYFIKGGQGTLFQPEEHNNYGHMFVQKLLLQETAVKRRASERISGFSFCHWKLSGIILPPAPSVSVLIPPTHFLLFVSDYTPILKKASRDEGPEI